MSPQLLLANIGQATENLSIFDPASPGASAVRDLAIIVLVITGMIFLLVEGVLLYSIFKFRRGKPDAGRPTSDAPATSGDGKEPPQVYGSHAIEVAWTAAPGLIVFLLVLVVARTEWDVRPTPPQPAPGDNTLFVTVIGRQWWWEYRYETYNGEKRSFITANELHIPACDSDPNGVQRPVYLKLESADVCHSFWIPRLGGKTDLIPGRTNYQWIQTSEQGLFLGQCAEFCGNQHAKMLLRVQVDSPEEFEKWLANEETAARTPSDEAAQKGQELFLKQSCVNCHRVMGTPAKGTYGPDLTHLMSRKTLAAGIMPNTLENLRQWVEDPQKDKPRCLMPAFGLGKADVDAIVTYLRTLE